MFYSWLTWIKYSEINVLKNGNIQHDWKNISPSILWHLFNLNLIFRFDFIILILVAFLIANLRTRSPCKPDLSCANSSCRWASLSTPSQTKKKILNRGFLSMTLNCIWWWGSSYGGLGNVRHYFNAITPRSTPTQNDSTC